MYIRTYIHAVHEIGLCCAMADRQLSRRSERRLRMKIARQMVEESLPAKCRCEVGDSVTASGAASSESGSENREMCGESLPADIEPLLGQDDQYSTVFSDVEFSDDIPDVDPPNVESCDLVLDEEDQISSLSENSDVWSDDAFSDASLDDHSDAEVALVPSVVPRTLPLEDALFPCSPISTHEFDVGFMMLCQRHNSTYACQNDLLKLLSITYPVPNQIRPSSHMLLKQFVNFKEECSLQYFCGNCLSPILQGSPCVNPSCSVKSEPNAVFIHVPLVQQLMERMKGATYTRIHIHVNVHLCVYLHHQNNLFMFFSDEKFVENLQYRFHRTETQGVLADIYDGVAYQGHEFFRNQFNISFSFNFDGAPTFKSSKMQLWPVQLYINEFPPHIR